MPNVSNKIHTVVTGDTLLDLCQSVYGDSKYSELIIKHNNIRDIHNLVPGTTLFFPPIAKTKFS